MCPGESPVDKTIELAGATRFRWQSAGNSHVGTVRKVNEDAYLDRPDIGLWAVADGMGGHEAGDVASRTIVEALGAMEHLESRDDFLSDLHGRLQAVNRKLLDYAIQHTRGGVIGSTVAALVGFENQGVCVWVGDSRIYLLRDGRLHQMTRDHSQVEELIQLGLVDRSEAESHPAGNVITRAVGAQDELEIDMVGHELKTGDVYLICSDGLNKFVPDGEISDILQRGGCRESVRALLDSALSNGVRDNVTAVVVHVG